jgi:hypothetical protein
MSYTPRPHTSIREIHFIIITIIIVSITKFTPLKWPLPLTPVNRRTSCTYLLSHAFYMSRLPNLFVLYFLTSHTSYKLSLLFVCLFVCLSFTFWERKRERERERERNGLKWSVEKDADSEGRGGDSVFFVYCYVFWVLLMLPIMFSYCYVYVFLLLCIYKLYATSPKVAGSIPDDVTGIFHWHNPSGRTMTLGLTQSLREMSTTNTSGGKGSRCVGLTTWPPSWADYLEIWEPQTTGTLRAFPGL